VIARRRKAGTRYTGMYLDPDGTYKSAGTFDTPERAQEVAEQNERHHRLRLAETSPADKATITIEDFGVKFLKEHAIEPNSKMTYAQLLHRHIYPYIGKRRVAEISRETIHRLLTVVLPEAGASRATAINTRTCLSAMLQMAWDHGYRSDNPVQGIRLKHPRPSLSWSRPRVSSSACTKSCRVRQPRRSPGSGCRPAPATAS
jgi:hypothetical protein